ncbi:MAG: outer membrane beta-barrel protein [Muribaculaceae bacterium]|nr:outer membrane beta-barrel protein [Muribaculaceae bacterium]
MKRFILAAIVAICSVTASAFVADVLEWTVGTQLVYGTEGNMPGAGLHFKTHYLDSWRTALSGNYYFEKNGVSCFDVNLECNYLFNVGEKIQLYPLVGGCAAIWRQSDTDVDGWRFESGDKTHYEIGLNVGGGIDYLLGEHWLINAEVKYRFMKNADQVLFGVGVGFRF